MQKEARAFREAFGQAFRQKNLYWVVIVFLFLVLISAGCNSINKKPIRLSVAGQEYDFEKQDINGILYYQKFSKKQEPSIVHLSERQILKKLKSKLDSNSSYENLKGLHLTLSYSRLTIAGESSSTEQINKLIDTALEIPEISEIISTVIIKSDQQEESIL